MTLPLAPARPSFKVVGIYSCACVIYFKELNSKVASEGLVCILVILLTSVQNPMRFFRSLGK